MTTLFDALQIGDIAAANRVVMAPLTRDRAGANGVPPDLAAKYYGQRASAGLIISEGTQISPLGQGYLDTPGIYSAEQIAGWQRVTDAVHAAGGKIVAQLWHVGRISHVSLLQDGQVPVSSSARTPNAKTFTASGFQQVSTPRALSEREILEVVDEFRAAAYNAMLAGFDGVEVHGAHGYLIEQFLRDSINDRTDVYGGSIARRVRFVSEVMKAIVDEIGAGRTGIRLSPVSPVNDSGLDSTTQETYNLVLDEMGKLNLAFIHMVEGFTGGDRNFSAIDYVELRRTFKNQNERGVWIGNNGYTRAMALDAVATGKVDAVAFGRSFISNPDLVRRLREDAPLAEADPTTMYGGDEKGYTDYPTLDGLVA
ncbi:alkene reductase [Paraburkholderia caledonica]|uniref:N-ethylmaleimide reductase n=1 Tax=Paraburkholderia caledonica TaxID=134536 RepID=A0ABU1KYY6_9BURK|nr:alkene reductase [Paraburkholderia caledonica]MDR6376117.1 N-ethylmaleimide reductase [Paraburkholderia caledonica]